MLCVFSNFKCPATTHNLNICKKYLTYQTGKWSANSLLTEEYSSQPEYPKIKDLSYKAKKSYEAEDWHEEIKAVATVEEKQIKLNMPRYYGHKVVHLTDRKLPYNVLPALQHYTRTFFEEIPPYLSSSSSSSSDKTDSSETDSKSGGDDTSSLVTSVKDDVKDCIAYAHMNFRKQLKNASQLTPKESDYMLGQLIVEQVNRVLFNALSNEFPHLRHIELDYNARHEASWCVGGIDPPKNVVKSKKGREWQKDMSGDPVDRWMQYTGQPYLSLRHKNQISSWKSDSEIIHNNTLKNIPRYNFDPRTLGYSTGNVHVTNIPGFWPGQSAGFGFINFCPRDFLKMRPTSYGAVDMKEVLHAQAIQSSFAWLVALASYNGFNTFNDLTYPMNTQTVVTNGKDWSFYEYQLNTLLMHSNNIDENPKLNFCRGTTELQLYHEVNDEGKCIGFNDAVLGNLVKFYVNQPVVKRKVEETKVYLNEKYSNAADYNDDEKREFIEQTFKHMVANRARHLELPEIYLWEKIYKIDNKTRSLEAKRRFFEVGINPWRRTLDQHQKKYIPRCKRTLGPKDKKNKWEKVFYP